MSRVASNIYRQAQNLEHTIDGAKGIALRALLAGDIDQDHARDYLRAAGCFEAEIDETLSKVN